MRITIGTISHNIYNFKTYLEPSLNKLINKNFDFISVSDQFSPAINYNNIINFSSNDTILLTHEDVVFDSQFLDRVFLTIDKHPDFGALGIEGAINDKDFGLIKYEWANSHESKILTTLDACLIVIKKSHNLKFDYNTFNDFHGYVEDYSTQLVRNKKLECRTIYVNSYPSYWKDIDYNNYVIHKAKTCEKLGHCWGKFGEYMEKLKIKWRST